MFEVVICLVVSHQLHVTLIYTLQLIILVEDLLGQEFSSIKMITTIDWSDFEALKISNMIVMHSK